MASSGILQHSKQPRCMTEPWATSGLSAVLPVEPTDASAAADGRDFPWLGIWVRNWLPLSHVTLQALSPLVEMDGVQGIYSIPITAQLAKPISCHVMRALCSPFWGSRSSEGSQSVPKLTGKGIACYSVSTLGNDSDVRAQREAPAGRFWEPSPHRHHSCVPLHYKLPSEPVSLPFL